MPAYAATDDPAENLLSDEEIGLVGRLAPGAIGRGRRLRNRKQSRRTVQEDCWKADLVRRPRAGSAHRFSQVEQLGVHVELCPPGGIAIDLKANAVAIDKEIGDSPLLRESGGFADDEHSLPFGFSDRRQLLIGFQGATHEEDVTGLAKLVRERRTAARRFAAPGWSSWPRSRPRLRRTGLRPGRRSRRYSGSWPARFPAIPRNAEGVKKHGLDGVFVGQVCRFGLLGRCRRCWSHEEPARTIPARTAQPRRPSTGGAGRHAAGRSKTSRPAPRRARSAARWFPCGAHGRLFLVQVAGTCQARVNPAYVATQGAFVSRRWKNRPFAIRGQNRASTPRPTLIPGSGINVGPWDR